MWAMIWKGLKIAAIDNWSPRCSSSFFHSSLIVWNAYLLKSHCLNPSAIPCYIRSKMLSSCRDTPPLDNCGEAERELSLWQPISRHKLCTNDNGNRLALTFLPWLKLFYLMTLPSSCSSWLIPTCSGKLLKYHLLQEAAKHHAAFLYLW